MKSKDLTLLQTLNLAVWPKHLGIFKTLFIFVIHEERICELVVDFEFLYKLKQVL